MTVNQLMNKLKTLPDDAIVIVCNYDVFVNGEYVATEVEFNKDHNTVIIDTNHEKRIVY